MLSKIFFVHITFFTPSNPDSSSLQNSFMLLPTQTQHIPFLVRVCVLRVCVCAWSCFDFYISNWRTVFFAFRWKDVKWVLSPTYYREIDLLQFEKTNNCHIVFQLFIVWLEFKQQQQSPLISTDMYKISSLPTKLYLRLNDISTP